MSLPTPPSTPPTTPRSVSLPVLPPDPDRPLAALAFDFGTQRIGVAFGQSISGSAQPITVLKARDGIPDWERLGKLIGEWNPDAFVVGLPYNMDGSDSELMNRAIKFGNRLHGRFHKPIYGMDERLSSQAAIEQVLEQQGHRNDNTAIDHIAAQIILENWFSELQRAGDAVRKNGDEPEQD